MNQAEKRLIAVARKEIGVREIYDKNKGWTNRGRRVDEYQRADLLAGVGYAWCVSFVAWGFLTALGEGLCDKVWLRSASCDSILDWGRRRGIDSTKPIPGCIGLSMASRNDAIHGFLVGDEVTAKTFDTIEGNTNDTGAREGNGVYKRTRKTSGSYLFMHWQKLLPATYSLPEGTFSVPDSPAPKPPSPQVWDLLLSGTKADRVRIYDNRAYVPAWKWAKWFGQDLGWDQKMQGVTLNGVLVPSQARLLPDDKGQNRAFVQVTALAAATRQKDGNPLRVTSEAGKVLVFK